MTCKIKINARYREKGEYWVADIKLDKEGYNGTHSYTGKTEEAAMNAAFAAIGYLLLSTTWKETSN